MKLNITLALLVAIILVPPASQAARPLGPPIAEFFKSQNRVARGMVVEKLTNNKIAIQIDDYLSQNDEKLVTLAVDTDVFTNVMVGTEYVFVFSRLQKNRLFRDEWEENPDGPTLVKARGLELPAIYAGNTIIVTLLTPPDLRDELSRDTETSMLLTLIENEGDDRARELAVFELYLRHDLQGAISDKNADRYAMITTQVDERLKNFLLQGARQFPEKCRTPWLGREFRREIATHGEELELNSDIPLLIKNSLLGLRDEGTVEDLEIIGKHLYSNAPGVAKAALTALDAIDPQQALARAQQAIRGDNIHLVTRRALITYIRRYNGA